MAGLSRDRELAEYIRRGSGPICRIDPVYVTQTSQGLRDEIDRECSIANLKKEGGVVQEAAGPKRGAGSPTEVRRAK